MTAQSELIFNNAELALAAYAGLSEGSTSSAANISALQGGGKGMTITQAEQFAARYTEIVAVSPSVSSSFDAVVFKEESTGKLTVAIRGTQEMGEDLAHADFGEIVPYGAAYHQIVDMYNWWMTVSSPEGQPVVQYQIAQETTPENNRGQTTIS